jgi:hypothetical protein
MHAIYLELFLCPRPQAGYSKGVDAYLGKFVFLTVQSVFILNIYFVLNALAEVSRLRGSPIKSLDSIVTKYSPVGGGFAIFLTIMFYSLCW